MIENFPYRTSRNYDRLLALLDAGHVIVCIVDYRTRDGHVTRDICRGRKIGDGHDVRYSFSARGIGYGEVWPDLDDDFTHVCRYCNLEFIDPEPNVTP